MASLAAADSSFSFSMPAFDMPAFDVVEGEDAWGIVHRRAVYDWSQRLPASDDAWRRAPMADQLERSGYGSPEAIAAETDVDRLALKSGLGAQKSQVLKEAAQRFVAEEWPSVQTQLEANLERVREAARAKAAEAKALEEAGSEQGEPAAEGQSEGQEV